jgi:hypothetical protein
MRTNSREFDDVTTLSYEHLDPASLNLLAQAIEAKARRMRAQAIRNLLCRLGRIVRNNLSVRATPAGALRHAK